MGYLAQTKGTTGEQYAGYILNTLDLRCIQPIHTAWKIGKWVDRRKKLALVYPEKKVAGDYWAVTKSGRAVLVEVKVREPRLLWSSFQEHQRQYLDEYASIGALPLVVWVAGYDSFVMEWPIPGFGPRKSISTDRASSLDLQGTIIA
jgi:hypothetical protein